MDRSTRRSCEGRKQTQRQAESAPPRQLVQIQQGIGRHQVDMRHRSITPRPTFGQAGEQLARRTARRGNSHVSGETRCRDIGRKM